MSVSRQANLDKATFRRILFIGPALLLASSVVACGLLTPSPPPAAPPTPPSAQPPPVAESQPPEQLFPADEAADGEEWNTVETFTGEGNETTPSFHISGAKWRITWAIAAEYPEYAAFDLFVHPEGRYSTPTKKISHSGDGSGDTVYIYEGGRDYYFKVIAANLRSWAIEVEDYATKASLSPVQITRIYYKGRDFFETGKRRYEIAEAGEDEEIYSEIEADEYVEIKNQGDCWQNIAGWKLKNISRGGPSFIFPVHMPCSCSWYDDWEECVENCHPPRPCALAPHQSIRVYTGEVHPESGGFCFYCEPGDIWNNEVPDTAVLYDSGGEEVSKSSYIIPAENGVSSSE